MQFKNIAIVGKYQSDNLTMQILELVKFLHKIDMNVYVDCGDLCNYEKLHNCQTGKLAGWLKILDLVIVVGGDGTLLSAARQIAGHNIPIIGVNQGRLGFMTDISISNMLPVLEQIIKSNEYNVEERTLINGVVIRDNKVFHSALALNDIVIARGAIGNMIEFDLSIDGQFVLSQKSDGVIFATPTGSTAYSLAAGGPILHPGSGVFAIVPICPQSMTNRPIVVSDNVNIEFSQIRENATQLHFDGQECIDLNFQDKVLLSKHLATLKLIHPKDYNYYYTLRRKLDWSKRVS
ncbi:MAG: kinase [Burkholderiales bacterium]|jgi:NAD+ kinase|nr:kinase [Burkholderiales bacterium]